MCLETPTASAHNLDANAVYIFLDPTTQAMLDARIASGTWTPGTSLILPSDELGLVIKAVPNNGTTTGVGGYTTFYLPTGVQVVDAAFIAPDGSGDYKRVPTHGQAAMPSVGAGGESTVSLVGKVRGPNILGTTSAMVTAANTNLGTLPGVYGDTGIFFSTDPSTALGTYSGGTLKNNSGDTVGWRTYLGTPLNKWDAWQMQAYGIAGTTNPAYAGAPIIDSNGRGYAPWGLASAVAGPQSGYAWEFDKDKYDACDPLPYAPTTACVDGATQDIGPWQRIQYPGSQIADDPPGANPAVQPYTRGADGSTVGFALSPSNPLPATTGQSDGTPNAIRWAFGQLTYLQPEFAWVKIKVTDPTAVTNASGCPEFKLDTFGGDAGGDSGGKDHIWRYYDPNSLTSNLCLTIGKPANRDIVKVGDIFQYKVKVYNLSNFDMQNVVVTDLLPSGVQFISSVPAQNSGPNPLVWNVGTLPVGKSFSALVTVKATSSGELENKITVTAKDPGNVPITTTATERTISGSLPYLIPSKSVSPASIAPGGTVQYTIAIDNLGSGPSGSPTLISDYLPTGFTFISLNNVTVNGANYTGSTTLGGTATTPTLSVPAGISAGSKLLLTFTAKASATIVPGPYCNVFDYTHSGIRQTTGTLACVTVGGGRIGDTIFRDWNNNGVQDPGEEGIAGVTVTLSGPVSGTAVTDANGNYLFTGLTAGSYTVDVTSGIPAGYTLTTANDPTNLTLATNEQRLNVDFGYLPGGTGSIGDLLFEDKGNDGAFTIGTDVPITATVTVWLYEDTNGDGVIDPINDTKILTTTTNPANGTYSFTGLAEGLNYIVKVDESDPDLAAYFLPNSFSNSTGTTKSVINLTGAYLAADFGYFMNLPSSIGDEVCIDSNGDGSCAGETLLPGVTVTLYKDGLPFKTTSTNITGTYSFTGLGPGNYTVVVDATDPNIPAGYTPSTNSTPVILGVGQNRTDIDFPFVQVIGKQVSKTNAAPGDTLYYTLTVNYPGPGLLTDAVVTDTIPTGTNFVSAGQGGQLSPFTPIGGASGEKNTVGSGNAVYNNNNSTVRYQVFNGTSFGGELSTGMNYGSTMLIATGAAAPTRNEMIVVSMINNASNNIRAMRWNGTAWTYVASPPAASASTGILATSGSRTNWGGAVAYEQLSGDAVMIWDNGSTTGNGLTYNVWNGTAWATNTTPTLTGMPTGEPQQMRIASRPNSDEMVLVVSTANGRDYALVWNGSAWGNFQTLDNCVTAPCGSLTSVQVAYEQQSGRAIVVYGKQADRRLYYRIWNGSSWTAEASLDPDPSATVITTQPQWVSIAADPTSNRLAVGVVTSSAKTWLALWNGSAWSDAEVATETGLVATAQNVAVAFETLSGELLAAYGVNAAPTTEVRYQTWSVSGGWSGEQAGLDVGGGPDTFALTPSPYTNRIMLATNDSVSDANYTLWDGDAWGTPSELATNTNTTVDQPLLFLFDRYQEPASTTTLTASPQTVLNGGTITVQMTLRATKRVTGVTPGTLTVTNLSANAATATCGAPSPASQTVLANVPTTFTWTCTAVGTTSAGQLRFSANASGTWAGVPGGTHTFGTASSDSIQVLAAGSNGFLQWNLGSNTAAEDGEGTDAGAALCPVNVTLYPVADTFIQLGSATSWQGGATELRTRPANTSSLKYALFRFDVSSLADKQISSAVFGADVTSARSSNHYDQVYRLKTAWTEGTSATNGATWSDPNGTGTAGTWTSTGGAFGVSDYDPATLYGVIGPEISGFYQYANVTGLVRAWTRTASPLPNYGLALISTGTDAGDGRYASREATGTATDPVLIVTYLQSTPGGCSGTTTLNPLGDTYVDAANAAVNYGQVTTMFTQPANASSLEHSLMWFNVGQIPAGATINSAVLTMTVTTARSSHVDEVHAMSTAWYEAAASWNDSDANAAGDWSAGTFGSGDYNATSLGTITPSTTGAKSLNITSLVNDWVNNGVTNRGLALISTGTDIGDAKYGSREDGTASRRPVLTINWTLAGNPGPNTHTMLEATPVLLTAPGSIKLTMTVSATGLITTVIAPASLAKVTENDANATCGSATALTDTNISGPGDLVKFQWTCTTSAGTIPGSVVFSGKPSATGAVFATATSNSVLVTPPLTFQVTVKNPATADPVTNTAYISDAGTLPLTVSNLAETAIQPSIGDRVWADLDGDGVQDPGEPGLAGVQVCATPVGGGAATCATTDANGIYRIFGLAPATDYTVTMTPATLPANYLPTTPISLTVTSAQLDAVNQYYIAADFGLRPPGGATIGDTVWLDANENGAVDGSETGLPGITVQLYDATGTNLLATTTTNASGLYSFTGLYAGNYQVQVVGTSVVTTSYGITFTLTGAMDLVSVAGITTTLTNPTTVNVPSDVSAVLTADFGYNWSGKVGDLTFYDNNGNGVFDGGDAPAPLVTQVLYYDADGSGTVSGGDPIVAVVQTDGSGAYLVENLPPGNYVMDPDEQTVESPTTPGLYMTMITSSPETIAFTLGTGAGQSMTNLNVDSGFIERAIVEGYVFHDVSTDGLKGGGEPGLPLVSVTISGTDIGGNPVNITIDTDPNGEYKFIVPPGNYTISYNTADGDIPGVLGTQTTLTSTTFTALAGAEYKGSSFDFGLDNTGSIGDRIWNDADGNGVQNSGEPGLPGVTVQLYASNGTTLLATTVTTGTGGYLFPGLADGTYVVKVVTSTVPLNYNLTGDPDGGTPHQSTVTLSGGVPNLLQDFGYQLATPTVSVSGTIFEDANGNSLDDEGLNITGVNVTLVYTPSGGSPTTLIVPVDGNGDYSVSGIPQGSDIAISVDESSLPNPAYVATTANLLTITNITSNQVNQDFGFQQQFGSIAGTVCAGNGDGICNPGEPALTGITVTLLYAGADGFLNTSDDITQTVTTNVSGDYTFTNLLPGLYQITETNPANYTSLADADGVNPDNISPVNLTVGQDITGRDFEDAANSSIITGGAYNDNTNGDGVKDPGEPGIPGVLITLSNGLTTTTDANGIYTFTLTVPGTYTITETNPVDFTSTGDTQGPNDDQIVVTVAAGQTSANNDFLDIPPLNIIGTVFADANSSQVQDGGELGTNAGGPLYVNLVDSITGNVVATTTVSANGLYTFTDITPSTTYTLSLTTNAGSIGQPAPAISLPAGWVTTGENANGTPDGTPNSQLTVSVGTTDVTGQNFGIEQLPDSNPVTATPQVNPGGTISVTVPALSGSDPEDGPLTAGTGLTLTIVTTPTNGTLYYDNVPVTPGQVIPNYDPAKLTVDPLDGAVTVVFTYAVQDAAGQDDPTPATVSIPFGALTPDYEVTKTLNTPNSVRVGETVSFTIRITNTGAYTMTTVPLRDTYLYSHLVYLSTTPAPNTTVAGQLDWTDLTEAAPNGFGYDLAPAQSFVITTTFAAIKDTGSQPGGVTVNTAAATGLYYDVDGPGGAAPQPVSDKPPGTAPVAIVAPTGVTLADAEATYADGSGLLRWRTVNESDLLGFHIYRSVDGGAALRLTAEMIPAQKPGQSDGAAYAYTDKSLATGKSYRYTVEFVGVDGPLGQADIGGIFTGGRIFLPAVVR